MEELRASVLAAAAELGSRERAWEQVLATVAHAQRLPDAASPPRSTLLTPWRQDGAACLLGAVHESLVTGRGDSGVFYTPEDLVGWLLDRALEPSTRRVLDPACGAGAFLVPTLRRLLGRVTAGGSPVEVAAGLHGVDLDPVAVAITRLRLRLEVPDLDPEVLAARIRVGDGLGRHPATPYDAVLGNPPFLGQLRARTASASRPGLGAYTDTSAVFLHRALDLVRSGGVVALVQPWSLLAARDAGPVRAAVVERGAVEAFWSATEPMFDGAAVRTCAPVVRVGADQGPVATWQGRGFDRGADVDLPAGEWGPLVAPSMGLPSVAPRTRGVLGDLGECTADFRDQYYGLVPHVHEAGSVGGAGSVDEAGRAQEAPLVTSGLLEPARCQWGEVPARFAKRRWRAPAVDLTALRADGALAGWAADRLVPKVLVATQGRVVEAAVDAEGAWLPSVPVLSLVPREPGLLWHALAVLLAPPVSALAASRYLGAALSPGAVKLSARQLAALPLPADTVAWDRGAELARAAQLASAADRPTALAACVEAMCTAYADHTAIEWWLRRAL